MPPVRAAAFADPKKVIFVTPAGGTYDGAYVSNSETATFGDGSWVDNRWRGKPGRWHV